MDRYLPGLIDYGTKVRQAVDGGADAFLAPIGSIVAYGDAFGPTAVVASVPTGDQFLPRAVEHALAIGADALKCMAYPFSGDDSLDRAQRLGVDAARFGLPFIVESIPGGFEQVDKHTPDHIAVAARLAAEAGADIVKTFYTGDPETMRQIIAYAAVPVVVLGGAAKGSLRDLFVEVDQAVHVAGCAGVAIGRNIWQADDPVAVTRGLAAIIHRQATVEEALALMEGTGARHGVRVLT
jgi:fructose-bisphosphate aldolase / 2-amino-3,7-dideoxy-D-threo-hept-6-ulosonate synthase